MYFFNRKKIGLALGCGGAKGLAHIGVLKVLEEKNYKIQCIAGSSAGALIGGLYAYFKDVKKVEEIFQEQNLGSMLKIATDLKIKKGVIRGKKLREMITQYVQGVNIEDLEIPFASVATDLYSGKKVVIKDGLLSEAIMASIAIPIVFNPIEYKDTLLMDGGIVEPVPYKTVKDMGCKRILGVDLSKKQLAGEDPNALARFYEIMLKEVAEYQEKDAWKIISPEFNGSVSLFKFADGKDIIDKGEIQARKVL
jgi:NTE family protein